LKERGIKVSVGKGFPMIYCDPDNDVVIVARWINGPGRAGLVERVLNALVDR